MLPGISAKTDQQLLAAYDLKTVHCVLQAREAIAVHHSRAIRPKRLRKREPSLMLINLISQLPELTRRSWCLKAPYRASVKWYVTGTGLHVGGWKFRCVALGKAWASAPTRRPESCK